MNLDEAMARIVELEEQLVEVSNERDTFSQNNETLSADLEKVRTLNQRYFEKLTAQYAAPVEGEKEEAAPSCEDFARTIKF